MKLIRTAPPPLVKPAEKRPRIEAARPAEDRARPRASDVAFHSVLSMGVFRFLSLEEATAVFHTCRALRFDAPFVVSCVLALPEVTPLFRRFDNAAVAEQRLFAFPSHGRWASQLEGSASPAQPAQVVSTAAFLKKRVLRWCFVYAPSSAPGHDDVLCSVRPVLMPLAQFLDPSLDPPTRWTRRLVTDALNEFCENGGDAFFDDKSAAESRFATHWDSIYVDRVSGRVSCRLCDAVRDSVALYKRQVELGLRQYGQVLRHMQTQWQAAGPKTIEELQALTEALHAKYFPPNAYIRPECLQWPESRLLRHICEHGSFQAWQIGDTRARGISTVEALLRAVSFKYQHQCRTFYQPLKKILHAKCQAVGRIPHAVLRNLHRLRAKEGSSKRPEVDDDEDNNASDGERHELVGGIDSVSGIFCGVHLTFRLNDDVLLAN
ncbi:hypothetical protein ATCC90586_006510 [Pythium insidiosum]|nr:hypothetical protein ATCC90586_006510 [Pythium insidiosum]